MPAVVAPLPPQHRWVVQPLVAVAEAQQPQVAGVVGAVAPAEEQVQQQVVAAKAEAQQRQVAVVGAVVPGAAGEGQQLRVVQRLRLLTRRRSKRPLLPIALSIPPHPR